MTSTEKKPFHLRGDDASVFDEVTQHDLAVVGALPPELNGHHLRNGVNLKSGWSATGSPATA